MRQYIDQMTIERLLVVLIFNYTFYTIITRQMVIKMTDKIYQVILTLV